MNKGTVATEQHCIPTTFTEDEVLKNQGGLLPEKLGGVCGPLPKTLTRFMTKICDFPYPIYDLTFKSKPRFWPAL